MDCETPARKGDGSPKGLAHSLSGRAYLSRKRSNSSEPPACIPAQPEALKQTVLNAVQANPKLLKAPAFDDVKPYGPLMGSYTLRPYVLGMLEQIKEDIRLEKSKEDFRVDGPGPMNDVLMIYYQGSEAVNENGNFFLTAETQAAIPCDDLVKTLSSVNGVVLC